MVISERHFQQFIKGDEKSFESIFCQYYKTLVSYAMRHDLELMEAEDVVLEIFHHTWLAISKIAKNLSRRISR